jgi:hypothetical protein
MAGQIRKRPNLYLGPNRNPYGPPYFYLGPGLLPSNPPDNRTANYLNNNLFPLAGFYYGRELGHSINMPEFAADTLGLASAILVFSTGLWLISGNRGTFVFRALAILAGLIWLTVVAGAVFYFFHGPYIIGTYHIG